MNELPLSQCSKCGSEVHPDDINWDMRYNHIDCFKVFLLGMVAGGLLSSLILWIRL